MSSLGATWLPGLVFLALAVWLVRKAIKAARTERDLEDDRLAAALAPDLVALRPAPPPAARAPPPDTSLCHPSHLALISASLSARGRTAPGRVLLLWARSVGSHAAWCERHAPAGSRAQGSTDVLRVAEILEGKLIHLWPSTDP